MPRRRRTFIDWVNIWPMTNVCMLEYSPPAPPVAGAAQGDARGRIDAPPRGLGDALGRDRSAPPRGSRPRGRRRWRRGSRAASPPALRRPRGACASRRPPRRPRRREGEGVDDPARVLGRSARRSGGGLPHAGVQRGRRQRPGAVAASSTRRGFWTTSTTVRPPPAARRPRRAPARGGTHRPLGHVVVGEGRVGGVSRSRASAVPTASGTSSERPSGATDSSHAERWYPASASCASSRTRSAVPPRRPRGPP
jgi:hypothetical protein